MHDILDIPESVRASFYVYNTTDKINRLVAVLDGARDALDTYLASDRYHDRIYDHYRNPRNAGGLTNLTFMKHSEETSCGDDGEFHIEVGQDGTID